LGPWYCPACTERIKEDDEQERQENEEMEAVPEDNEISDLDLKEIEAEIAAGELALE